jgi:hypothetical protein
MYRNFLSALYVLNIIFQAIFTLLTPPLLLFLVNYLCVSSLSFPKWTYAISLTLGFILGIISMIKFALSASEALERLEKQRKNEKD